MNLRKANAWLKKHPEVEVFDYSPYDNATDTVEAGYMFISELEAILRSGNEEYDDDYILACAEMGVIDDPDLNPEVEEFDY